MKVTELLIYFLTLQNLFPFAHTNETFPISVTDFLSFTEICKKEEIHQNLSKSTFDSGLSTDPTNVEIEVKILRVDVLDEVKQYFELYLQLILRWSEPRLAAQIPGESLNIPKHVRVGKQKNRSIWKGLDLMEGFVQCLWIPNIQISDQITTPLVSQTGLSNVLFTKYLILHKVCQNAQAPLL